MIKGVYAIRDALTGYLSPTCDDTDQVAVRNFEHAVLNSGSLLLSHPQHYTLYRIAWFDTINGQFSVFHPASNDSEQGRCPELLADASQIVALEVQKNDV